jgi:membrane protein required for colicin V production
MAIDLICAIVALYGAWQGYNRGIIATVFNILAYVFGIVISLKVTPVTTELLNQIFKSDNPLMFIAGFLLNIGVVVLVLRLAASGIENMLDFAHLGTINKLLGAMLSGGLSVVIYSVLVWFGIKTHVLTEPLLRGSRTYEPLLEHLPTHAKALGLRLKPLAEDGWNTFTVWLDRVDQYKKQDGSSEPTQQSLPDESNAPQRKIFDLPKDDGIERTTRE